MKGFFKTWLQTVFGGIAILVVGNILSYFWTEFMTERVLWFIISLLAAILVSGFKVFWQSFPKKDERD